MSRFYRDKRVLVTGGAGFIGSNLAIRLTKLGASVHVVDSLAPRFGASLTNLDPYRDEMQISLEDVRDQDALGKIVPGVDLIFSLAGQVSHLDSMQDPHGDLEINCESQLSLLECCRHGNPQSTIVFASTRQLYGRPQYVPVDEDHPLHPVDVNGINKLAAEMYYTLYQEVYGMQTVSLRLTNTYGPRMDLKTGRKGFVGVFLDRALKGQEIELFGDGSQRRDFNYIDDVCDALLLAGETPSLQGGVFNLGARETYSLREFAEMLRQFSVFEIRCVPFPPDRKAIDIGDYAGNFDRFAAASGWNPQVGLEEGLRRTVEYFRQQPDDRSQ
ncbi:MAG: NAD-dependent epimerase/dehydratase family protein [Acidobacteriota bacterium]|nr:NAD-dependent epimerase/dehydratase family protein [Acidobacteriota bacterium]MDH3786826.1 NAD-dependent epimerase/dehydratase family protein [Acidobacteriota bacterium]